MRHGEYIELLRQMVRTPSLSFEEEAVRKVISSFLDSLGIRHFVERGNIIALNKGFDPAKKTLALDAHMDTVPASSEYTCDPFDPGRDESIIHGLGSNDDGGSVVSMIAAFHHYYEAELPVNLTLVLTREEERSGPDGARWIYAPDGLLATSPSYPFPDWAIVGEPTGMRAATSERGLLVIDGQARGVSGHAARNEGVNALYVAMDDIATLRKHEFTRHSPLMGDVHLNVTCVSAGKAHNVIPDTCDFTVDIRPTERYTNEELLEELRAVCTSTLKARNLDNKSSATFPGSPLLRTARELGLSTFSSPTTSDWMRMGIDAIKMGPGDSARSHKADEYILTDEIRDGIDKYIDFIGHFHGDTME